MKLRLTTGLIVLLVMISGCNQEVNRLNRLEVKLDDISRQLDALQQILSVSSADDQDDALAEAADPEFARKFALADPNVRREMIQQRLDKSRAYTRLTAESLPQLTQDLMSLDSILTQATNIDLQLLADVEQQQRRLLDLLATELPALVTVIGKEALAEKDFREAQRLWNIGNAVLEYYPSTDDPMQEAEFQQLTSAHERIGSQIEQRQLQRYNQWACQQLKQATQSIETAENDIARKQICLDLAGPIDPSLLDPLSLDLYSDLLDVLKSKVALQTYYEIGEAMSVSQRKSLVDI